MSEPFVVEYEDKCPVCAHEFDAIASADQNVEEPPEAGDVTICISCSSVLILDETLHSRVPTEADYATMPADFLEDIKELQEILRRVASMPV